jgi:hypothetical protein
MQLVDGDQFHIEFRERLHHAPGHQPLGRQIEKPRFAFCCAPPCCDIGFVGLTGMDRFGCHARELQRCGLVLDQCDERRYHDRQSAQDERRHLEAERLP